MWLGKFGEKMRNQSASGSRRTGSRTEWQLPTPLLDVCSVGLVAANFDWMTHGDPPPPRLGLSPRQQGVTDGGMAVRLVDQLLFLEFSTKRFR